MVNISALLYFAATMDKILLRYKTVSEEKKSSAYFGNL